MLWHFPRVSFIIISVLDCHDDTHSRCEGCLPFRDPARTGEISELMYGDDTLILAANDEDAAIYMQCIEQAGRMYGLQLNWKKVEVLPVRCRARVTKPNGDLLVSKESFVYLGNFLCDNGSIGPELNRRVGVARLSVSFSLSLSPVRVGDYGPEKEHGVTKLINMATKQSGLGRTVHKISQR